MRIIAFVALSLSLVAASPLLRAEVTSTSSPASPKDAIPISQLISAVSRKTHKRFLADPRVQADVSLNGQEPSSISYDELLLILQLYGYSAIEVGNYVQIIPDASSRTMPVPLVSGREKHADAEIVSKVIEVKTMPAAHLVPLLRPLLPQYAHLTAVACTNTLIMVDRYANVKRIETLVQAVDTGQPYQPTKCATKEAAGE